MKIKIKVTKEILERAKMCGFNTADSFGKKKRVVESCAFALAIKEIAPDAFVYRTTINWSPFRASFDYIVALPEEAITYIDFFDLISPEERVNMPEIEVEVDFPDELVNQIGIDQVKEILSKSKTLELV